MAVRSDLRSHTRALEALLKRVAAIESASGSSDVEGVNDLFLRMAKREETLSDDTIIGPKKLAIKLGARMDLLNDRMQEIENRDKAYEAE